MMNADANDRDGIPERPPAVTGRRSSPTIGANAHTAALRSTTTPRVRYGKKCARCGDYFIGESLEERVCVWCERIEKGEDIEPSLVFSGSEQGDFGQEPVEPSRIPQTTR